MLANLSVDKNTTLEGLSFQVISLTFGQQSRLWNSIVGHQKKVTFSLDSSCLATGWFIASVRSPYRLTELSQGWPRELIKTDIHFLSSWMHWWYVWHPFWWFLCGQGLSFGVMYICLFNVSRVAKGGKSRSPSLPSCRINPRRIPMLNSVQLSDSFNSPILLE